VPVRSACTLFNGALSNPEYARPNPYKIVINLIGILGGGVQLGPLGTAAINGLLCPPRVIMMMDKLVEWLAGETEVLG
jgi:hypothetical protein